MAQRRLLVALWITATVAAAALLPSSWCAAIAVGGGLLLLRAGPPAAAPQEREPRGPQVEAAAPVPPAWQHDALQATATVLPDGLLVLDGDDQLLTANAPAQELLGLAGTTLPRPIADCVDWPQLAQALLVCRRERKPQVFEATLEDARTLQVTMSAHSHSGLCVVLLRDLSRLRQLESIRRDFVANVSHELKTPLAAIQGFVETLIDDPEMPPATRQRFLERVHKQVGRLATLVADLLTLSRLDEHQPGPAEPCDLVAVVREVARDLQPLADRRAVALRLELPDPLVRVAAEREALRQVVSNLVDNALKYTPERGTVTVGLLKNGRTAALQVVDTGIGLSEPDQERVFERFYRVDKARSSELGSTGLGLSIVKNTVQGLGGEVGVQSRLGRGSTFWVRLPLVPEPPGTS